MSFILSVWTDWKFTLSFSVLGCIRKKNINIFFCTSRHVFLWGIPSVICGYSQSMGFHSRSHICCIISGSSYMRCVCCHSFRLYRLLHDHMYFVYCIYFISHWQPPPLGMCSEIWAHSLSRPAGFWFFANGGSRRPSVPVAVKTFGACIFFSMLKTLDTV